MTTKTIGELCYLDLGKRVRVRLHDGDVAEGPLRRVVQNTRTSRLTRFAATAWYGDGAIFEIQVGMFLLAGLRVTKEVEFL